MKLPDKLCRKHVKSVFNKVSDPTWEYLFDHDRENGLFHCRTQGYGLKKVWYATKPLINWLISRGYYLPEDFETKIIRKFDPWTHSVSTI